MNKVLKQLVDSGLLSALQEAFIEELRKKRDSYDVGTKPDKTIASDIKSFKLAEDTIKSTFTKIKSMGEIENKKDVNYK